MNISLDIDKIPQELYDLLLEEMRVQFGKAVYTDWVITAVANE